MILIAAIHVYHNHDLLIWENEKSKRYYYILINAINGKGSLVEINIRHLNAYTRHIYYPKYGPLIGWISIGNGVYLTNIEMVKRIPSKLIYFSMNKKLISIQGLEKKHNLDALIGIYKGKALCMLKSKITNYLVGINMQTGKIKRYGIIPSHICRILWAKKDKTPLTSLIDMPCNPSGNTCSVCE